MTTLSNAAAVLDLFSVEKSELTVTDVATALGLPKSNVSRLLRAMKDAGFLQLTPNTRRYHPGIKILELGQLYRRSSTLMARASAVAARASLATGHSGYVNARLGREVRPIFSHEGSNALRVGDSYGRALGAAESSPGRALLARLDDDAVRALHTAPLQPPSPNAPQNLDDLLSRLATVRIRGYAESSDEGNPGVGGIAVAVGDPHSSEEVSIGIAYPISTVTENEKRLVISILYEGAREIADLLGDPLFPRDVTRETKE